MRLSGQKARRRGHAFDTGGFGVTQASKPRRQGKNESGQVLVLVTLLIVPLLAIVGLVIDVGYAYYAQRSLQRQADAAALAGAQKLPDSSGSISLAKQYGSQAGARNRQSDLGFQTEEVITRCLKSVPGCDPVNAVQVDETAHVPTLFSRLVGYDNFTVHVRSTACSPCGVKPLDLMMVLDRTGSMCMDHNGNPDAACTDLNNARNGMKTFLGYMNPSLDWVGLAVFPPSPPTGSHCNTPSDSNYNSTSARYTIVPLAQDYLVNGNLNNSSNLVSTLNCVKAGGNTGYALAIEKAQAELDAHGRAGVQDVIVFFSDGAANYGPTYLPSSSPYRKQPCHQGVNSAAAQKSRGTLIYSIGYDLNALNGGANKCQVGGMGGPDEVPAITAYQALSSIASNSNTFYNQPTAGQLNSLFTQVASDIQRGVAGLIDNNTP
jgi:Flp pilus assembly protein TadG